MGAPEHDGATSPGVSTGTFHDVKAGAADEPSAGRLESLRRSGLLGPGSFVQFDKLTELAAGLIGAPVSLMSMVEQDRQFFTSQFGLPDRIAAARQTPLTHSVCATVVAENTPLAVEDMSADERFVAHPSRSEMSVEAYCGVPIRDQEGHVLGSFCVIDDQRRAWTADDIALLQTFAEIIGDYIKTRHEHHMLITDLQARLIPAGEPPTLDRGSLQARYRPMEHALSIGGDFYDWNVRHDGSVDLILGDVVGHGIVPAQAAAQLRAAARAVFFGATRAPDAAAQRVASSCAAMPGCNYASLTVARIAGDGNAISFVRAGSLPPLLVGHEVRLVEGPSSPPLGVAPFHPDDVVVQPLEVGESLLFFTDGLIERRGESIDEGFERLAAVAGRTLDVDEIISEICPVELRTDDVAVLAYTRLP